jgi:hypothetical protein
MIIGCSVTRGCPQVSNAGWRFVALADGEGDEVLKMRGYSLVKAETETAQIVAPPNAGTLYVTPDLQLVPSLPQPVQAPGKQRAAPRLGWTRGNLCLKRDGGEVS